ncbi:uncharacterized protein LOC112042719 [Lingula anatina]|uniref:Uncharacterized protein LOC112042719 n=1 Tax=Lingula anatina TaxID=7574 RepID=A0A2R2MTC9_LINAN|nr:uncharacterized protein LOC112042719 [Lingula anatina]|eukprot:XP_023933516.1 uncharacterized protein LOC112042719 [Lingula anatina]
MSGQKSLSSGYPKFNGLPSKTTMGNARKMRPALAVEKTSRVVALGGTAVLLDILGTRDEKALCCLCDCLERNGQGGLVAQIQSSTVYFPRDCSTDRFASKPC